MILCRLMHETSSVCPLALHCDIFVGQTPFDVIVEHEEWIRSGYFDKDIQARLKGACLLPLTVIMCVYTFY